MLRNRKFWEILTISESRIHIDVYIAEYIIKTGPGPSFCHNGYPFAYFRQSAASSDNEISDLEVEPGPQIDFNEFAKVNNYHCSASTKFIFTEFKFGIN